MLYSTEIVRNVREIVETVLDHAERTAKESATRSARNASLNSILKLKKNQLMVSPDNI